MGTISEALWQNCPSELFRMSCVWVRPGEGEKILGGGVQRDRKNVSLRSRTEKWEAEAGIHDKRVYGFGTKGWIGTMAMLMRQRSWTRRKDPLVFLTANMGVLNGE